MSKRPGKHVWDLPTRLFHWTLVVLIFSAWASFEYSGLIGDTTMLWHRLNGYAILVLMLWRILWGIFGSPASRFANFLVWPWTAAQYGFDLLRGKDRHYLGHNPLGTYMILALLGLVTVQGVLGLFSTEHNFVTWGPLSNTIGSELGETLTNYHVWLFENVILIFIVGHIAANVLYRIIKKDRLIEAMVTGRKSEAVYDDAHVAIGHDAESKNTIVRALVCLAVSLIIFVGGVLAAGGKFFS